MMSVYQPGDVAQQWGRLGAIAAVLMALAILTHYSAVIAVAAVGSVRLFRMLRARDGRMALEWAALHALLAVLAALLVGLLASLLLESGFRREAVDDWLAAGFPREGYALYWLTNSLVQLIYFVDPPRLVPGALLGVLLVIGCFALRRSRGFELGQALLVASAANLLLAALRRLREAQGEGSRLRDEVPAQVLEAPPAGKALVNFHRPYSFFGGGDDLPVFDRKKLIGNTKAANTGFQYVCEPGEHVFISRAGRAAVIQANLSAGKVYDIAMDSAPGVWNDFSRSRFSPPSSLAASRENSSASKTR